MQKLKTAVKKIDEKRLAAYAAAAGAALVAASPAAAAINYTSADITLNNSEAYIDIDGNGDWEFQFGNIINGSYYSGVTSVWFNIDPNANASFVGYQGPSSRNVSNLNLGHSIQSNPSPRSWLNQQADLFGFCMFCMSVINFPRGSEGYVGIRFDPGDGAKYGWIHIDVPSSGYTYNIDGWAYDDTGKSIMAGQTVTVVPEPSSLALFAAGAAALSARKLRRKKSKS